MKLFAGPFERAAALFNRFFSKNSAKTADEEDFLSPEAALIQAAAQGDLARARRLATKKRAQFQRPGHRETALMAAAAHGHLECARALLPFSDALQSDASGGTALTRAAARGDVDCVRLLLPASDACAASDQGLNALMMAAAQGHAECVRLLLPLTGLGQSDLSGNSVLHLASGPSSNAQCLEMALAARASPDWPGLLCQNRSGSTALMVAAMSADARRVRFLLDAAKESGELSELAEARNDRGQTALMIAAWGGHADCVRFLAPVSDASARDGKGQSALRFAATTGNAECAQIIQALADPSELNPERESLARLAARNHRQGLADWLAAGADPELRKRLVRQLGPEALPRAAALVEREALLQSAGLPPEGASPARRKPRSL